MTTETTTFHHGECFDQDDPTASEIKVVPRGLGAYDYVCKACGERVGFMLDQGELDLGIVRDAVRESEHGNKYEVWGEPL